MATRVLTHLMFDGNAQEAMQFYVALTPKSFHQKFMEMETTKENSKPDDSN